MNPGEQNNNDAASQAYAKSNLRLIYTLSIIIVCLLAVLVYLLSSQLSERLTIAETVTQEIATHTPTSPDDSEFLLAINNVVLEKIAEERARGVVTENFSLYEIFYVKDNQYWERIGEYETYIAGLASDSMVGSSYYDVEENISLYEDRFTDLIVTRRVTQRVDSSCQLTVPYPSTWQDLTGINAKWRIESKHLYTELFENTPGCFDILTIEIPIFVYLIPVSAKQMPNVFSYKDLEIGRQIGDMKISSIEQKEAQSYDKFKSTLFRNFTAKFTGRTTIVGHLEPYIDGGLYGGISYEMGITEEKVKNGEIKLTDLSDYIILVDLGSPTGLPIYDLAFSYIEQTKSEVLCIRSKEFIQMADLAGVNINDKIRVVVTDYDVRDVSFKDALCTSSITGIESITRLED